MDKNRLNLDTRKSKGGNIMALLAKPGNGIITIDKNKSNQFFEDSRKNIIKPEFLEKCQKYAKMMKGMKSK